jgi:hypothetical protein
MRIAPCVLAVVVASATAGCAYDYYGPDYAYAPPRYYASGYSYTPDRYDYCSTRNYYWNYTQQRYHNDWP